MALPVALAVASLLSVAGCTASEPPVNTGSTTAPSGGSTPTPGSSAVTGSTGPTGTTQATKGTTPGTTSTTRPGSTTTATTGSSTTALTPSTTGVVRSSSTVASSDAEKAFCAKGDELFLALKDVDPDTDPAGTLATLKRVYAELAPFVPPALTNDFTYINNVVQAAVTFEELAASEDKALNDAAQRIDAWTVEHCGRRMGQS